MATQKASNEDTADGVNHCDPCFIIDKNEVVSSHMCVECRHQLCAECVRHHGRTLATRNHSLIKLQPTVQTPQFEVSGGKLKLPATLLNIHKGKDDKGNMEIGIENLTLDSGNSPTQRNFRPKHVFTTTTLNHSVNVSRESDEGPSEITGLCMLGDKLIVCDQDNCKLKVFDSSYKFLYEYRCDNKPRDICMIDDDAVAVSLWGRNLKVLSVGNDGMKELNNINTEYKCVGVCCYDGKIYCVVQDKIGTEWVSQVRVYTPSGQIKRRYEHLSDGKIECNNLEYITVNPQTGILYVTDFYKGVVALSTSGDVIAVISTPQLKNPQGIAVDDHGHIYVCGVNSHNVIQMSDIGKNVTEFLSNNSRCSFAQDVKIYGNKMFLARRGSSIISIYKLS